MERMHEIVRENELDALAAEVDGLRAELLSQADEAACHSSHSQVHLQIICTFCLDVRAGMAGSICIVWT